MKERLKKDCARKLRMIIKLKVKAKNKITATVPLAVPG
jgi:hypothetical protein